MHEFETFAYLDVQKTGSGFISNLLSQFCSEKELFKQKHARVDQRFDPKKFYFTSVRDPYDQYVSLYSFGCGGRGGLFSRLKGLGRKDLYDSTWDGFRRWLSFVLEPESAPLLEVDYGGEESGSLSTLIGFQSFRFLELTLRDPFGALGNCTTKDDIRNAFKTRNIASFVVRHEHFQADMEELLTTELRNSISDLDAALKFLREGPRFNASDRVDRFEADPRLGLKHRKLIKEREWFLREEFDY